MPKRPAKLSEAQRGDLTQLWERHAPSHTISLGGNPNSPESGGQGGRGGRGGKGRGRNNGCGGGIAPATVVALEMGKEEYAQICRLHSFFRWVVCNLGRLEGRRENDVREPPIEGTPRTVTPDSRRFDSDESCRDSSTLQSLLFLFEKTNNEGSANDVGLAENSASFMVPKIRGGNLIIPLNHALFLQELNDYEDGPQPDVSAQQDQQSNDQPTPTISFGSYLHHHPDRALVCVGCAIGLVILSLWRQNQSFSSGSLPLHSLNNHQHPQLSTLDTAIYRPRFYNLAPSSQVRMAHIRTSTVDCLISLRGTVTKARPKRLRVLDSVFTCSKCGLNQVSKFVDGKYTSPTRCVELKCRSQKFVLNRKMANFSDVQELRIQEVREEFCEDLENGNRGIGHGDLNRESGRAPRHMEVEVSNDLVDQCHAGDSIVVVGIVRALNSALASGRAGKRAVETSTYKLYVVAHSIVNLTADDGTRGGQTAAMQSTSSLESVHGNRQNKRQRTGTSTSGMDYTDQELQQIANIAHADHLMYSMSTRMAFPFDLLVRSLCPSIIGNDLVKAGMILCLLGGTPAQISGLEAQSGMTIRSNSHMLIVGDPGMGKSQMLLSANQVASRSVYVGGNTASSTGLTVSLTKEAGGDMGIEAGALVLADKGVCCLDELDKMPRSHQDGLLEAMEQQQVSIAKAGVVASLPSRCSIIAAANPKSGHYNMAKSVAENLNMPGPLLSRFDLVFILRDHADCDRDRLISGSIMGRLRMRGSTYDGYNDADKENGGKLAYEMDQFDSKRAPLKCRLPWVSDFQKQPLPMQQVKDYIAYAREHCRPQMTAEAANVLQSYFMQLRHTSGKDSVPITTRQLEALIRLSQARAKACLRPVVLREDAEDVVELMIESVKQVHMDEGGQIDKARGGVRGKGKQQRMFLDAMRKSAKSRFELPDLQIIAENLNLPLDAFKEFIENLRETGEIQRKHEGPCAFYSLCL